MEESNNSPKKRQRIAKAKLDKLGPKGSGLASFGAFIHRKTGQKAGVQGTKQGKKGFDKKAGRKKVAVDESKIPNDDLNWVATGGSFGKKRRFPTFVVKKEGNKYNAYDEQNKMSLKAGANSLEGLSKMLKPYIEKRTGSWKFEEVELDERNYALERKNYHGKPEQMERNRARKRARYALEKAGKVKCGDKMDVHHKDNNPLNNDEKNLAVQTQAVNRSEPRHRDDSVAAEGMNEAKVAKKGGRPRGAAHIENVRFWDLPEDQLRFIMKDAAAAIKANPGAKKAISGPGNWADQINDAATVLYYRKRKGIKESVLKASGVLGWMKRKGELDTTEIEEAGRQFPKGKAKADHLSNLKKKVSQAEKKKGKASFKIIDRTPKGFGVKKESVDDAFEEIEEDRKPLTVVQRLRRRQVMRRSKFKLQRARKIKSKKLATGDQLRKRSRKAAIAAVRKRVAGKKGENFKNLAPGDKASVERRVASKGALVNKLARRLMPQIRKKEQARFKQVRSRKTNEGAETNIAQAKATDSREKMVKRHADEKARNRDRSLSNIDRAKARDKRITAKEAIIAKSEKSGIPVMTLVEVFKRGQAAYVLNDKHTRQQWAFARVNSFIAGGKAREMDSDLCEVGGAGEWGTDELRQRYAADTPGQTQDIQVASYTSGKPEIAEPYVYQNNADMIALIKDVAQQAINREKK